jgi:hypothetical protein
MLVESSMTFMVSWFIQGFLGIIGIIGGSTIRAEFTASIKMSAESVEKSTSDSDETTC